MTNRTWFDIGSLFFFSKARYNGVQRFSIIYVRYGVLIFGSNIYPLSKSKQTFPRGKCVISLFTIFIVVRITSTRRSVLFKCKSNYHHSIRGGPGTLEYKIEKIKLKLNSMFKLLFIANSYILIYIIDIVLHYNKYKIEKKIVSYDRIC